MEFFLEPANIWLKSRAIGTTDPTRSMAPANTIFLYTVWAIWKARNNLIFNKQRSPATITAKTALTNAMEFKSATSNWQFAASPRPSAPATWIPPPDGFFKLNSDGSVQRNSAAAGGLIRDQRGDWVSGFSMNIGPSSIADSELWGLRQGIFQALQLGINRLIVESDSLEAIQALTLHARPNSPGPALLMDCRGLLQKFEAFQVKHTPRTTNHAADFLAKLGHTLNHGATMFATAPDEILSILSCDKPGHVP